MISFKQHLYEGNIKNRNKQKAAHVAAHNRRERAIRKLMLKMHNGEGITKSEAAKLQKMMNLSQPDPNWYWNHTGKKNPKHPDYDPNYKD